MRLRGFIAAVAAAQSSASGAASIHLAPSSPWVVNYAQESCRLVRRFGSGKDLTTLAFESEAPGFLDMLAFGRPLSTDAAEVKAKFLPVQSPEMNGRVGRTTDRGLPSVLVNSVRLISTEAIKNDEMKDRERMAGPGVRPPPVSLAEQATRKADRLAFAMKTTAIEIDPRKDRAVILDTGALGDAIKAFDQCSHDSLRDWGIDPEVDDRIVRGVWTPSAAKWFSPSDYPRDMLVRLKESVVKVRLLVDATGRVTKCTSLSHFEEPEFNRITCANFMARAHFEPAELADGTKVPSYYVNNVMFRLAR